MLRSIVEQPVVMEKVDEACGIWPRGHDAWNTITWVVMRDANVGHPVTESGKTRSFTVAGAVSIGLPTVTVLYEIERARIIIHDVLFESAKYGQAGTA